MKLHYYCSFCKKENSFKTKAKSRIELKEKRGSEINERCKYCGTVTKRRVNRVHAKPNMLLIIGGGLLGILILLVTLLVIPSVFILWLLPSIFAVPFFAWRSEEKRASVFNKLMVNDN